MGVLAGSYDVMVFNERYYLEGIDTVVRAWTDGASACLCAKCNGDLEIVNSERS